MRVVQGKTKEYFFPVPSEMLPFKIWDLRNAEDANQWEKISSRQNRDKTMYAHDTKTKHSSVSILQIWGKKLS